MRALFAAVIAGLIVGALSALGTAHLDGTPEAFANSISTWLVAPFLVGTLATSRRGAALSGFATCVFQLLGFYAVLPDTTASLAAFWFACAVVGGPVFGLAGHQWRTGVAVLGGAFIAEGLYAFLIHQHEYLTGVLWIAIGVGIAACSRPGLRWLGLTVPLGIAGEVVLTSVLQRYF